MLFSRDGRFKLTLAIGLASLGLLGILGGLNTAPAVADGPPTGPKGPVISVGLNGDPCAYSSIQSAKLDANEGDTFYVSAGYTHTELLGRFERDFTIVAATDDYQNKQANEQECTPIGEQAEYHSNLPTFEVTTLNDFGSLGFCMVPL